MREMPAQPSLPAYGSRSLAEVVPSLLAALGASRFANTLEVPAARAAVLLVVDGLGWEQLLAAHDDAPFLARAAASAGPITSGYPASTATSLAMLSTARPPIAHGLTGYTMAAPGLGVAMNNLAWTTHGPGGRDLRAELPPETVQPLPTVFELAAAAGVAMAGVGPAEHRGSGLTRAILRGGRYVGVEPDDVDGAIVGAVSAEVGGPGQRAVYAYDPQLDAAGHRHGPGSKPWRASLRRIDGIAARLAGSLPLDAILAVTADHGMVDLGGPDAVRLDVADRPDLAAGVRFLAGEARARHVHANPGEADAVLARWRDALGGAAWVVARDEAIERGWFGPPADLREPVRERIGDVVAAAAGPVGVFQRRVDPGEASLVGHHGSLTSAEQLVPWIVVRGGAA
jgi:hypothetical protein